MNRFDIILGKKPSPSKLAEKRSPYFMGIDVSFRNEMAIVVGHFAEGVFYVDSSHSFDLYRLERQVVEIRDRYVSDVQELVQPFFGRCDQNGEILSYALKKYRIPCDVVRVNSSWLRGICELRSHFGIRFVESQRRYPDHSFNLAVSLAVDYLKDKEILTQKRNICAGTEVSLVVDYQKRYICAGTGHGSCKGNTVCDPDNVCFTEATLACGRSKYD